MNNLYQTTIHHDYKDRILSVKSQPPPKKATSPTSLRFVEEPWGDDWDPVLWMH
jgi:hypothetical protein